MSSNKSSCSKPIIIVLVVGLVVVGVGLGVGLGIGLKPSASSASSNGGQQSGAILPLIEPIVQSATPPGLLSTSGRLRSLFDPSAIKSRFFQDGPAYIFSILQGVDNRTKEINAMSLPCLEATTPVAYTIQFAGDNYTYYAQCSELISIPSGSGGSNFLQFGVFNSTAYFFAAIGDSKVAAEISNYSVNSSESTIRLFYSVGVVNVGGSHGVVRVLAKPAESFLEFTAAGVGIGFCGVQFQSNGVVAQVVGVEDGSSSPSTLCLSALDFTSTATDCSAVSTFVLPAIGTTSSTAPNNVVQCAYPGGSADTIVASGDATDSIYFGPSSPVV